MTTPHQAGPILSEFHDDPDMAELVEAFVRELPTRVEAMRDQLRSGDLESLKRGAHQLKGSCGGYGFPVLTEAAATLEERLSGQTEAELERVSASLQELVDLTSRVAVR